MSIENRITIACKDRSHGFTASYECHGQKRKHHFKICKLCYRICPGCKAPRTTDEQLVRLQERQQGEMLCGVARGGDCYGETTCSINCGHREIQCDIHNLRLCGHCYYTCVACRPPVIMRNTYTFDGRKSESGQAVLFTPSGKLERTVFYPSY